MVLGEVVLDQLGEGAGDRFEDDFEFGHGAIELYLQHQRPCSKAAL